MPGGAPPIATVICPLDYERRTLRRSPLLRAVSLVTSGPGSSAVRSCLETLDDERRGRPVVLAGVAGALRPSLGPGTACTISQVIDAEGDRSWTPPLRRPGHDVVATSTAAVLDAEGKGRLAGRCPADLVDLESVAFAEAASAAGLTWAIVRGISDGRDQTLPPGSDRWVRPDGRTRVAAVAAAVARRPALVPELVRLGRRSRLALGGVALQVATLLGLSPE